MTDRKKPTTGFWLTVALIVVLPVGAYAGAYARMVKQARPAYRFLHDCLPPEEFIAVYSSGTNQVFWQRFFAPMNWLDRQVRPQTWAIH